MDAAVETKALTKSYGQRRGIVDVDLLVRSGEVFGFLGPNGAGKTTTIRLLVDIIRPTRGTATVLGLDPRARGVDVRRQIGYLPGELAMHSRTPAKDLLRFFGDLRGGVPRQRIEELAQRLDLDLSGKVRSLSKGNKQKVGLVQAFMHQPRLLILDEPTSGLDPLVQQEFLTMVREAKAAGQTVFMSSHILAEVQHVADRVGIIRDGRLVAVEDVDTLRARSVRRAEIKFAKPVDANEFQALPNVSDVEVTGTVLRCVVSGDPDALVKAATRHTVKDITISEPDLEEIFLTYYAEEKTGGA